MEYMYQNKQVFTYIYIYRKFIPNCSSILSQALFETTLFKRILSLNHGCREDISKKRKHIFKQNLCSYGVSKLECYFSACDFYYILQNIIKNTHPGN